MSIETAIDATALCRELVNFIEMLESQPDHDPILAKEILIRTLRALVLHPDAVIDANHAHAAAQVLRGVIEGISGKRATDGKPLAVQRPRNRQ